jgi:uncharacterized protein with HEPN domain
MPFRSLPERLRDIEEHIDLARHFAAGMTQEMFRQDVKTVYAVTRCLAIISEASRHLPRELKQRHPAIPRPDIAGAGSVYRHSYENVESDQIWATVTDELEPLRQAVVEELARLDRGDQ